MKSCFLQTLALALAMTVTAEAETVYQVGFAKVNIMPDELTWLSGYGSRTEPAEGKVHDLYAKAAAFEDTAGARLVLVTLDLGSVNPETTNYVAKQVEKRFGVPRAKLVLNCSHTHCAPEISLERRVILDFSDKEEAKLARYIEQLNPKLVELVGEAIADMKPVELSVSRSTAKFAFNRRHPSGVDINGPTDREVPVLRVTDLDGKLRGILFGYACHNTTLRFQLYCGDYAGFAQYDLEERYPGATAMFVMGCGGDQNPQPRHGDDGLKHAQKHGRELADAVTAALDGEQRQVGGPLKVAYDVATLDLEPLPEVASLRKVAQKRHSLTEARKAKYLLGLLDSGKEIPLTQPCPLHVVRFGDELLLICISGETVVDYSIRCKREFAGPFVWIAGYCDDVFAYLPSRRVLLEGGYEGRTSTVHQLMATPFQDNVEDRVIECIQRLVAETKPH
jgi:hypothetical protein